MRSGGGGGGEGGYDKQVIVLRVKSAAECPGPAHIENDAEAVAGRRVPETTGAVRGGRHNKVIGHRPVKVWQEGEGEGRRRGKKGEGGGGEREGGGGGV